MKLAMILGRWSTGLHGKLSTSDLYVRGRPLTGSESAFFNMARALSERGHEVTVYCDCHMEERNAASLGGASVISIDRELGPADAYVSLNEPEQLKRAPKGKLRVCWQQLGDFPGNQDPDFDSYVDRYVALSPRHMEYIIGSSSEGERRSTPGKWSWIPNSINVEHFEGAGVERRPFSMAWCSSPDRGLHRLLEMFPEIRERVPEATLDVYYRFDPWYQIAKDLQDPIGDRARYINECLTRLGKNGENGVKVWGPVPNVIMAKRLMGTVALPYTCDCLRFTETFSVSIMDACAAGCVPIISDEDAIGQIFGGTALVIPGKPGSKRKEWIESIVRVLDTEEVAQPSVFQKANKQWRKTTEQKAREFAHHFSRANVAKVWEHLLSGDVDHVNMMPTSISQFVALYGREDKSAVAREGKKIEVVEAVFETTERPIVAERPAVEIIDRPLRVAVILGKTGSPVHGVLDVERVFAEDGAFATGTVTGFFNIAWGLAERGHTVDAFCECKENVVGSKLGGANFYNIDREQVSDTYDVYISVNEADMLRGRPKDKLKIVALWLNDFSYCSPGWDEHVDVYACPSETHGLYIRSRGEVPTGKLDHVPLCVSWELHDEAFPRRPGSIAYCSSPDRGLHHLLAAFPQVRERVPNANLSIYYRLKPWYENVIATRPLDGTHMRWRADQIKASLDEMGWNGERGVTVVGPVSPRRMARELRQSVVMAYPCDPVRFTEGFSAAVLDACAAGCVPIIAGVDALPEVYWGAAHVISGNPGERSKAWVDTICLALTDEGFAAEVRAGARARAREFSRAKVAAQWENLFSRRAKR